MFYYINFKYNLNAIYLSTYFFLKTSIGNHVVCLIAEISNQPVNGLTPSLAPRPFCPHIHFVPKHTLAQGTFRPDDYFGLEILWLEDQIFKSVIFNNFVPSIGFIVTNVIFLQASEFSGE